MIDETQLTDEMLSLPNSIQEQFYSQNGKLYLWGAGDRAYQVTQLIKDKGVLSIEAYVVSDAYYKESTFLDRPIIKASDFLAKVTENDWVVMSIHNSETTKEVMKQLPSFVKCTCYDYPLSVILQSAWLDRDFFIQNKARFESTRNVLADESSKNLMDAYIKACVAGKSESLNGFRSKGEYFNELTSGCKPGCFVDCGAYTGDTIEAALDFLGNRLERVIAFEPEPENYEKLKEYIGISGLPSDKVKLLKKGSYDKADVLCFTASWKDGSHVDGSHVNENVKITIETDSVDNVAADMGEVSFIKIDVEGSELKTILGAAETIRKYRPTIAVCVYHKRDDLFEVPEAIRKITNDRGYKYYLRYYAPLLCDLILYAIPD